jgi:hypothetical protein
LSGPVIRTHFATVIDRALSIPLQRQLYEQWREAILTGRFRAGQRVLSLQAFEVVLGFTTESLLGGSAESNEIDI